MIGGYNPWFIEQLQMRLGKERVEKAVQLGGGLAIDFSDYRFGCGVIFGLELASTMIDELKQEIDKA